MAYLWRDGRRMRPFSRSRTAALLNDVRKQLLIAPKSRDAVLVDDVFVSIADETRIR